MWNPLRGREGEREREGGRERRRAGEREEGGESKRRGEREGERGGRERGRGGDPLSQCSADVIDRKGKKKLKRNSCSERRVCVTKRLEEVLKSLKTSSHKKKKEKKSRLFPQNPRASQVIHYTVVLKDAA